jgi:hypothetical protein
MPWIGQRAAESVTTQMQAAVSGGAPNATDADAVRFASLTDLLAWLSADLAAGRAARCWYWKRWMRLFELPVGEAITTLWEENIELLPAVTASLAVHGALTNVWRELDAPLAARLTSALARRRNLPGPFLDTPIQPERRSEDVTVPDYQLQRWGAPLAGLPSDDSRATLAALLVCLECRPATLLAATWQRVGQVSAGMALDGMMNFAPQAQTPGVLRRIAAHRTDDRDGRAKFRLTEATSRHRAAAKRATMLERDNIPGQTIEEPARNESIPVSSSNKNSVVPGRQEDGPPDKTAKPVSVVETSPGVVRRDLAEQDSTLLGGREFLTNEGGLFYLINILCRTEIRELFKRHEVWSSVPNGWSWLYVLGTALGLDESGPLAEFLNEQIVAVDGDEFDAPDSQLVQETIVLARNIYKESDIDLDGLLPLVARVCLTETHLDIHMPSCAVRLSVRLAGLDINPGWVAWLGRVVTFHYDDDGNPLLPVSS